jgi:hypothetical protein
MTRVGGLKRDCISFNTETRRYRVGYVVGSGVGGGRVSAGYTYTCKSWELVQCSTYYVRTGTYRYTHTSIRQTSFVDLHLRAYSGNAWGQTVLPP